MARSKPQTTVRRTPSETHKHINGTAHELNGVVHAIEHEVEKAAELAARDPKEQKQAGIVALVICVLGIYGSLYVATLRIY